MTLKEYYQNLPKSTAPKTEFLKKIVIGCDVSFTTARHWVDGLFKPQSKELIGKLSEITGIPEDELWETKD